jgi:hypothetical protein
MEERREGMLRPEFQDWYPSLQAGRWYTASQLAGMVLDHLEHGSPQWRPEGRVPSDAHFEFRGGSARHGAGRGTRSTDRQIRRSEGSAPTAQPDS